MRTTLESTRTLDTRTPRGGAGGTRCRTEGNAFDRTGRSGESRGEAGVHELFYTALEVC